MKDRDFTPTSPLDFPSVPEDRSKKVREEMRELALSSHYYLAKVVLGYTKLRPQPHGELCDFLDFLEHSREAGRFDLNRSIVYMPRDTYKTTIATITRAIRRGLRDPNTRGLIVADTGLNAERFGIEISNHFRYNTLLQWLFPEVIPENFNTARWNMKEMVLKRSAPWRDPTFDLMGAGGGIESRHFDWIIADDLVTEKHIHSDVEMDGLIKWIGGLEPLLVNDVEGYIDFVGSRKKKGDAYEHVEKYYGWGETTIIGPNAVKKGQICIYSRGIRENGKIIFPYDKEKRSGISEEYLNRMMKHDPERYWAQMANSPKASGLNLFAREWFGEAFWGEKGAIECHRGAALLHRTSVWSLDRFIFYDPSIAEKQTSSQNAIIVCAKGTHPFRFILESFIGHYPPDEAIEIILAMDKKWKPLVVSIEERGYQGSIKYWLQEKCERENISMPPVVVYPPEGSVRAQWAKPERIKGLQPSVRAGLWWMVGGYEAHKELIEQAEFFPNVRWDDGLDALAQSLDYFGDALDEEEVAVRKGREETMIEAAFGRPLRAEEEWDEEAFLAQLDATGYGLRLVR